MKTDDLTNYLNQIWNFHIAMFGISLSIFTLVYSFILSKRDELKNLTEMIKNGYKSNSIDLQIISVRKYINKFSKVNNVVGISVLSTFIMFLITWLALIIKTEEIKKILLIIISSISLLVIIIIGYIFYKVFTFYREDTKIK